ncbi:MAG: transaldolase, partial [Chloroflexi bacterium]|nr:transaldolase [Chloroflexota bacterium]
MTNPVQEAQRLGQSIWYDNIRRGLITSGELQRLIDMGITGLTSNPTIFEKAIAGSTDYDVALLDLTHNGQNSKSAGDIFEALAIEDIRAAADLLRPIYDQTGGVDGYASLEVSPYLAKDTERTIAEGRRLFAALDRPNVLVKVPATPEGIAAVRQLIAEGINVNVTLIFSLDAYRDVREAYIGGLEDLASSGGDVSRVASVASFFVSRVDTAVDRLIEQSIGEGHQELTDRLGKAAISNAKLAYQAFQGAFGGERFNALRAKGARVQRPLWASTGTKNPAYSDVLYLESLIGPDTVNTVPPATLTAFLEHGRASVTLEQDVEQAGQVIDALAAAGISMEQVTEKLLADGLEAFADSFQKLMANIEDKKARLLAREHEHPGVSLGSYLPEVEATLADLQPRDVVGRIWRGDHTVWKPDPTEITDRLDWLTVTDIMCDQVTALQAFANEVREAGFRHLVLLGMGGSSLGPEVLRQTFGSAPGYPKLIVLDSTVP